MSRCVRERHVMTRAKRDFGTIRKRANGRYQAYYMGPDQGFHRAPSTFQTKSDAEGWLAAERRLIQNDEWSPTKSRRAKVVRAIEAFAPYAETWLEQRDIKTRTRALYRRQLDRFLLPAFGEMSLRDITPAVVRSWYSGLDPKHPTQRAHVYSLLRAILNEAVRDEIITRNPCNIRSASVTRRQITIDPATPEEIKALMAEMPQRYHAFVLIGAWCGLRFGEMSELRRRDIDLVSGVIHVRRAVVWDGGEPVVGPPKNGLGRSVTMPPHMVELVAEHIEKFAAPGPDGLLFHAIKDPSRQVGSNTVRRHWIKARNAVGRPTMRVHDLRHSGAVLAVRAGATGKETQDRLGHLSAGAADRYQHAARGRDAEIAKKLSELAGY